MKYQKQISANRLRELRVTSGLRQQDVADLLGFQITDRISHWENGVAIPNLINLFRLCAIYKVDPSDLYSELLQEVSRDVKLDGIKTPSEEAVVNPHQSHELQSSH